MNTRIHTYITKMHKYIFLRNVLKAIITNNKKIYIYIIL